MQYEIDHYTHKLYKTRSRLFIIVFIVYAICFAGVLLFDLKPVFVLIAILVTIIGIYLDISITDRYLFLIDTMNHLSIQNRGGKTKWDAARKAKKAKKAQKEKEIKGRKTL